jgi:predicted nucleotidyltransferase
MTVAMPPNLQYLSGYTDQIHELCHKHNVRRLFAFGSALTDRFNAQSDVDLIVDFDKAAVRDHFLNYFDFKYALEEVFGRKVDLLEEQPIRNSYLRKNIESTKILIYG